MNAHFKIARVVVCSMFWLSALLLVAGAGCDEEGLPGMSQMLEGVGTQGADGEFNYSFTEGRDGRTSSFSFNSGISAHESVETYLGDSIVY